MTTPELSADELTLPIKRTDGDTIEERLTGNAYHNILPARYLKKDANGDLAEDQEDLFKRVARNIALAEAVYEAEKRDVEVTVTPDQVKPDHPRRDELAEEVFGAEASETALSDAGTTVEDDIETTLTENNVNRFAYETVVPELPEEIQDHVESAAEEFQEMMERLSFMPNSPTLMNAGDELQQLSACFVDSPEDDLTDIHQTAKEAAEVFQSGGGMGYAFWRLRPYGDAVGSTGGIASGPITFMETFDQMCETIAQGGARRGAQMAIMRASHPDVIEFMHSKRKDVSLAHQLKLNDPDDFTYTTFSEALKEARELIDEDGKVPEHLRNAVEGHLSNFNISVGVTDDFMEALENGEEYTFINPRTGEPHVASEETEEMYGRYDLGEYVEPGEELSVPAEVLWERIVEGAHENGEPGVIYLDRVNDEHSFPVESTPTGDGSEYEILATNPCVAEGTLVNTPDGYRPVEEIDVGEEISTVIGSETVDEIERHDDYSVYRVEFSDGGSLDVTAQHRFHVLRDDKQVEKIPLCDVEEGDHVRLHPSGLAEEGTDEEYERELKRGILLGDGCYTETAVDRNHVHISTSVEDEGYNERVKDLFGEDHFRADDTHSEGKATKMVLSDGGAVVQRLDLDPSKAPGKSFDPTELTTEAEVMGVLDGLLATDGNINLYSNHPQIRWDTSSEDLADAIRNALLSVGIHGRISVVTDPKRGGSINGRKISANNPKYTVNVSGASARRYAQKSRMDEIHPEKGKQMFELRTEWMTTGNTWKAQVESIEKLAETTTVYDLYCSESDTWITEGYVQQGCGEQPLMEYEACNLGHINLSTVADRDAPDWRVWSDRHREEYDSLSDAVDAFLAEAIDREEFDHRIEWGTRFLENVVTMSNFPVEKIEETVRNNRKVGLGIMGLAQLYIQLGVAYGSEVANEIARQLMVDINHGSKWTSHELAGHRASFANWEDSKYANPTEYADWFERMTGLDAEEWADGFPIRNHNTTTIAPTGTTSMVSNTSGGCEPIYNVAYYKNVSDDVQGDEMLVEFDDYFLRVLEDNDIPIEAVKEEAKEQMATNNFDGVDGLTTVPDAIGELFVTTSDLSAKGHASVQCACQTGVDSAISKCLEKGTLVQTDSGVRSIDSFADQTPEPGEFTEVTDDITIDGVPVESQYYAGEKDATRVRVDNGTELVGATDSHKVLTPEGWTVLSDLQEGDHVIGRHVESHGAGGSEIQFTREPDVAVDGGTVSAMSGTDPTIYEKDVTLPEEMSPHLAKFLGMYAADGGAIDACYSIEISTSSERVRDKARNLFEELFGREPSITEDRRHGDQRDTVYGVTLNSKPVWEFVRSLCGAGSYDKKVPREVLQGSPEEKLAFVNGVTLDGYVSSQSLVVYGGMSKQLADGVAELLRSFGVPKVYVGRRWIKDTESYAYQVHVTNEAQEIVTPIEPHKRVDRFDQRYRVYVPRENVDKTEYHSRSTKYYAARNFEYRDRNYMFDTTAEKLGISDAPPLYEVTDVEDAGTREMYDIELAGPHEYVVGGVVSHNTTNAPHDSTVADAKEVFEYIYDNGGKGVTYYRDGTRSKQVLTTRAQNTEFSDMDEDEATEALLERVEDVFGGMEEFLAREDVREAIEADVVEVFDIDLETGVDYSEKRPRPDVLHGVTQRIETGYGKLYVNINEDERGQPFELFATIGNSGGFTNSFTEALAKTVSTALRSGVDPGEIADELQGIRSPKVAWDKGEQIQSIPDAVGTAIRRYLDGDIDRAYPQQRTLEETTEDDNGDRKTVDEDEARENLQEAESSAEPDGGVQAASNATASEDAAQSLIDAGESPECPECGSMSLHFAEGCKTCKACGWSEC